MDKTPRIARVTVPGPTTLRIKWKQGPTDQVELAGWIATGGDILSALNKPAVFAKARVADYGSSVAWGDDDDLRIDAVHLEKLAREQRPFGAKDASEWQTEMRLSNSEVASFLGIAISTWNTYKAGGIIPAAVAMLCRAAQRDPVLMHAHFRPRRTAGRPRKTA
jgi:type IV secretory pathway TrbD component